MRRLIPAFIAFAAAAGLAASDAAFPNDGVYSLTLTPEGADPATGCLCGIVRDDRRLTIVLLGRAGPPLASAAAVTGSLDDGAFAATVAARHEVRLTGRVEDNGLGGRYACGDDGPAGSFAVTQTPEQAAVTVPPWRLVVVPEPTGDDLDALAASLRTCARAYAERRLLALEDVIATWEALERQGRLPPDFATQVRRMTMQEEFDDLVRMAHHGRRVVSPAYNELLGNLDPLAPRGDAGLLREDSMDLRRLVEAYIAYISCEGALPVQHIQERTDLVYPPRTAAQARAVTAVLFEILASANELSPELFYSAYDRVPEDLAARPLAQITDANLAWTASYAWDWAAPMNAACGRPMVGHRTPRQTAQGPRVCISYGDGHTVVLEAIPFLPGEGQMRTAGAERWQATSEENGFADDIYASDLEAVNRRHPQGGCDPLRIGTAHALEAFLK